MKIMNRVLVIISWIEEEEKEEGEGEESLCDGEEMGERKRGIYMC